MDFAITIRLIPTKKFLQAFLCIFEVPNAFNYLVLKDIFSRF